MRFKAQASIELLILTAASIAAIAILLPAAMQVQGKLKNEMQLASLQTAMQELEQAAKQAEIMGDGFQTTISFKLPENSTIEQTADGLSSSFQGKTTSIAIENLEFNNENGKTAVVENIRGKIIITIQ